MDQANDTSRFHLSKNANVFGAKTRSSPLLTWSYSHPKKESRPHHRLSGGVTGKSPSSSAELSPSKVSRKALGLVEGQDRAASRASRIPASCGPKGRAQEPRSTPGLSRAARGRHVPAGGSGEMRQVHVHHTCVWEGIAQVNEQTLLTMLDVYQNLNRE